MRRFVTQFVGWTIKWSNSPYGLLVIFLFVFIDASLFPLPTTIVFVTISLIHPNRSYYNALMATSGMLVGGIVGYSIGHYLWLLPNGDYSALATYFFNNFPGFTEESYLHLQMLYNRWSNGILFLTIFIPIPFQVFSISAGAFNINFGTFIFAIFLFQGFRFVGIAWLIIRYGEDVKELLRHKLKVVTIITIILLLIFVFAARIKI